MLFNINKMPISHLSDPPGRFCYFYLNPLFEVSRLRSEQTYKSSRFPNSPNKSLSKRRMGLIYKLQDKIAAEDKVATSQQPELYGKHIESL